MLDGLFILEKRYFFLAAIVIFLVTTSNVYAESKKARLAVTDFTIEGIETPEPKMGAVLANLMTEELIGQNRIQVVERELIKKLLTEKKLSMAGITSGDSTGAYTLLGVDYILGGSNMRLGKNSKLTARLINAKSGVIKVSEDIPYKYKDDIHVVVRNLAKMINNNFDPSALFLAKRKIEVKWEVFSSDNSQSLYTEKTGESGTWSYKISSKEESFAGITFDLDGKSFKANTVRLTCRSLNGYQVYLRFYSFVPGFSSNDDDETFVPVEKLVNLGEIASEFEATHQKMEVPEWWRKEKNAPKVSFNPDDIRYFEIAASEEAAIGTIKDVIEILRVTIQ
jgi:TolB-like protein